jgi:putative DNA primase/helicase
MSNVSSGNYAPEKQDVLDAAEGRWDDIFQSLAAELLPFQKRPGWHGPCPVHGGEDGFRVFKKTADTHSGGMCQTCGVKADGIALLMWVNKWTFSEALAEVGARLRIKDPYGRYADGDREPLPPKPAVQAKVHKGPSDAWIRESLRKIWKGTVPLTDPAAEPARLYLRSRAILCWDRAGMERSVRFHPALTYKDEKGKLQQHPAIVTLVISPAGDGITVNRLYLTPKGEKAPLRDCKMMFPIPSDRTLPGAAVITSRASEVIDVAEGLETSLAIETALGLPVWPMVNTYLMEQFVPPAGTTAVRIWADKDRSGGGRKAAEALKVRLWEMGIRAQIKMPPMEIPDGKKSVDWNDVLIALGPLGFMTPEAHRATR